MPDSKQLVQFCGSGFRALLERRTRWIFSSIDSKLYAALHGDAQNASELISRDKWLPDLSAPLVFAEIVEFAPMLLLLSLSSTRIVKCGISMLQQTMLSS